MERAGDIAVESRISTSALVKAALDEHGYQASAADSRPSRQAPQVPIAFLAEFERVVVDPTHPTFVRVFSWYRLVRLWSSMRFDNHRGRLPEFMTLVNGSLRGTLTRTKTACQGKTQVHPFINVDHGACVSCDDWLPAGWVMKQRVSPKRDYFLTLATHDFSG